jgi:ATP-binding cassette, subfamily B, bacterial
VKLSVFYFPTIEFAGTVATAVVIGIGGTMVHRGDVSIGTVVAFVLLLANLFEPIQQLSLLFNTVQSSAAALSKLYALLDTPSEVHQAHDAVDLPSSGSIEVRHVTFGYAGGDRPALEDAVLTIDPGERIALVGPTGAGKSTLAKLIARLYDPVSGSVAFGGVDLRRSTAESLRERIVVVPQEGYLFAGTIRENVRIARPAATDHDVERALAAIGALDRFLAFPEGLETEVRERGARLSAGEKQLVSLARAALVDPAVLVLDEATSSLDPGTELAVEEAIERLSAGRTVIAIAHRLSTAQRADRVVVVDDARVVEVGHHSELVRLEGRYTSLHRSWVGADTFPSS